LKNKHDALATQINSRKCFLKNKHDLKERVRDIKVESREFTIKSIKLVKSTLLSEGPVYETVAEFPLS
jgi:2'-5' RNA ligase